MQACCHLANGGGTNLVTKFSTNHQAPKFFQQSPLVQVWQELNQTHVKSLASFFSHPHSFQLDVVERSHVLTEFMKIEVGALCRPE